MAAAIQTCQWERSPRGNTKSPAQARSLPIRQRPSEAQLIDTRVSTLAANLAIRLFLPARRETTAPRPKRIFTTINAVPVSTITFEQPGTPVPLSVEHRPRHFSCAFNVLFIT